MQQPGTSPVVEVGIVDSQENSRSYLAALISGTPELRCWCSCATAKEALERCGHHRPQVLLASLFLRDMSGTEFLRRLRRWPEVLPILLMPESPTGLLVEALEAGARAYLVKPYTAEDLVRAIWTVRAGGAVVSSPVARSIVDYFGARGSVISRLTERERQVLTSLSAGLPQQAVAKRLGIDKLTVRTHVHNILTKLEVHATAEAIALYLNPQGPLPAPHFPPHSESAKSRLYLLPRGLAAVPAACSAAE